MDSEHRALVNQYILFLRWKQRKDEEDIPTDSEEAPAENHFLL